MKTNPVVILAATVGICVLAGCQHQQTLAEAQALCTKQGGFLVVIYSQKITASGVGPQVASPGDCVSSSKFDVAQPQSTPGAPGSALSAASPAPASAKPPAPAN